MRQTKQKRESGIFKANARKKHMEIPGRWYNLFRHRKPHRQIKDRLFRFLFEKDKEALLQLYNALNGTDYANASDLQVVTIESAVYIVMKNDLAFVIAGTLNLYEHQSTYNPNMPVRFLIYLAEEYQKLIECAEESLYGSRQISLPTPQCIVFYNGGRKMPEEQILRLSDAFENKEKESDVELKVRVLNINYGHNKELMEKCRVLQEYAEFVDIARRYAAQKKNIQEALDTAIDYCIDHDILSDFLRKYQAEVLGMLLEEFDVDKYERSIRAEGIEIGIRQGTEIGIRQGTEIGIRRGTEIGIRQGTKIGIQQGTKIGIQQGTERANKLTRILLEQNRIADLQRSVQDIEYQEELFREFDL